MTGASTIFGPVPRPGGASNISTAVGELNSYPVPVSIVAGPYHGAAPPIVPRMFSGTEVTVCVTHSVWYIQTLQETRILIKNNH